jgi:hypothetical protein
MALGQEYLVDASQLPTSAFATSPPLPGLKCEVLLHHAEASVQRLFLSVSFI